MEEIYEIIGKHLRNESTDEENSFLKKWISKEKSNERIFQEAKAVWNKSADLRAAKNIEVNQAWVNFLEKTYLEKTDNQRFINRTGFKRLAVAASIILSALLMYLYVANFTYDMRLEASSEILKNIELPDGSFVWLNKNASITFNEDEATRNIKLIGQAYFDVSHNPVKPFTISTGDLITQVVGTSFDINYSDKEEIKVSVVSGKVKVFESNIEKNPLLLTKDLGASYNSESKELNLIKQLDKNFLAWKTGVLKFENTPIEDVVATLSRHYNIGILVENSDENSRLTAVFDNIEIAEIIELIKITTDANLSITQNIKNN